MLPIMHGAWVTGVFVQDWTTIRDKDAYIILTLEEGVVFKVVENKIKTEGKLVLHSLNPIYQPYDIMVRDIREIWQFIHFISPKIPENPANNVCEIIESIRQIKQDINGIQTKLNL
jgi:phage repressor protein C with HTH and peptisase S24 domain